mmetsp:Transcript_14622/g.22663  ORF Transcript_14622/g.22663 Transcript_14622/m.22663 type:complete len:88 (+) Transcript_14622:217-480(+)
MTVKIHRNSNLRSIELEAKDPAQATTGKDWVNPSRTNNVMDGSDMLIDSKLLSTRQASEVAKIKIESHKNKKSETPADTQTHETVSN